MKGKNMTIDELMLAAIVSSETCRYIEIDGKKYNQAIDILQDHGGREILGYTERLDHSVEVILKPIENKAPERAEPVTSDWIRFDPDDKLTWPEMEDEISGKTVLACDDEGHIYIAYLLNMIDKDPMWSLTNEAEDVEVPVHCVVAWMPLPKPYTEEADG